VYALGEVDYNFRIQVIVSISVFASQNVGTKVEVALISDKIYSITSSPTRSDQ
jgi:hypothetical protein